MSAASDRAWRANWSPEYREKRNAQTRAWFKAHPDKVREIQRRYRGIPTPPYPAPERCECRGCLPGLRGLQIDHDHETGEFRGWICFRCNTALGKLGDTVAGLKEALAYLENSSGKQTVQ